MSHNENVYNDLYNTRECLFQSLSEVFSLFLKILHVHIIIYMYVKRKTKKTVNLNINGCVNSKM